MLRSGSSRGRRATIVANWGTMPEIVGFPAGPPPPAAPRAFGHNASWWPPSQFKWGVKKNKKKKKAKAKKAELAKKAEEAKEKADGEGEGEGEGGDMEEVKEEVAE
ncbi:hypothetical protein MANI_110181 [Metarhizium anisopliae]|nr:hypothetical protein MANI_110181 [Metarhizium anisopliae]